MFNILKLRDEWIKRGYKNKEIAEITGMTPENLSRILSGEVKKIDIEMVLTICSLIEKPVDMFITKEK